MLRFQTTGGANLALDVDFSELAYANFSFLTEDKRDIPFHLSLRHGEQRAVINRMQDGAWIGETSTKATFEDGENRVEMTVSASEITVVLNGAPLLSASLEDFPDTDATQFLGWNGGILRQTIAIDGPANADRIGEGRLALEHPFTLTGWAWDFGQPEQSPAIMVDGMDSPLSVRITSDPVRAQQLGSPSEELALRATLPGRVWQYADAEGRLVLRATSNGCPCGEPLELTREAGLDMIEETARRQTPNGNSFAALCALEHVRFGGFFDDLGAAAQRFVIAAANLYNVTPWLFPDGLPDSAEPRKAPSDAPGTLLIRRIREMLGAQLAANPETPMGPALESLLETWPIEGLARRALVLGMMEAACGSEHPNDVETLHRLIAGVPLDTGKDAWSISLRLPLLLLRGGVEPTATALQKLEDQKTAWVCPPALGWVMGRLATIETNPWDDRHVEASLRCILQVIERIAKGHWRQPCRAMIAGAVTLLAHCNRLPDQQARNLRNTLLRCYGAAPEFWTQVEAAGLDARQLGPRGEAARDAFEVIRDPSSTPEALDAALRHMQAIGVIEAPRLRLELLGPGGGGQTDMEQTATGLDPDDLALRSLAHPGNTAASPRLSETARDALIRRWNNVEKAPYYQAQKTASSRSRALIEALEAGADSAEINAQLDVMVPGLRKLSGQMSGFLGLALLLILIGKLERRGATAPAERLMAQLDRIKSAMPQAMADKIHTTPAPRSALARLERDPALQDSAVVRATLALFPNRRPLAGHYPEDIVSVPGDENASALFDTLVTVFSCKPYLDSRVAAMREGWLKDLEALGVPYIVVVGDGDGRIEGNVVHLDAPDDYEGLPQKTLAAAKWVFENTCFDHMLKIDDDCFLNVTEYFDSLSYRKFDYYGRSLTRKLGAMNRTWHHEKSQSERAKTELDKSPEPSSYADGGGGYTLSRHAMKALLEAAGSAQGWRLIDNSYMEDKMVGDLLALRDVRVASEDYFTTIWRRTHGPARQIMLWDNYFLPSAASPCKMAHLDTAEAQVPTHAIAQDQGLFPRKLWPTWQPPRLGYNSNQLELLSPEADLARLNAAELAVICTERNELPRLPQFLKHYRDLGVECFLFVDNASDDGSREYLLEQPDCAVFSADTGYAAGQYGLAWQMTLTAQLRRNRWSLVADADELLVFKGWNRKGADLGKFVSDQAQNGADAFRLSMMDMYPKGPLSKADPQADPFKSCGYTDTAPVKHIPLYRGVFANDSTQVSAVRHRLLPDARALTFLAQKYALFRYQPWMRFSEGLHYAAQVNLGPADAFAFAHFKYDAGFAARVVAEVARGQHFNEAEEYRHYAELLTDGDAVLYDALVSVPWAKSETAKAVLG